MYWDEQDCLLSQSLYYYLFKVFLYDFSGIFENCFSMLQKLFSLVLCFKVAICSLVNSWTSALSLCSSSLNAQPSLNFAYILKDTAFRHSTVNWEFEWRCLMLNYVLKWLKLEWFHKCLPNASLDTDSYYSAPDSSLHLNGPRVFLRRIKLKSQE